MCKTNNEGVKFKDGTFVKYEDIDLLSLTEEQVKDLYATPLSLAYGIQIRKRLHEQGNFLQKLTNKIDAIDAKLDEAIKKTELHTINCPINVNKVNDLIDKRVSNSNIINEFLEIKWKEIFKETIITSGNIAKAITAILLLMGLIFTIMEMIKA